MTIYELRMTCLRASLLRLLRGSVLTFFLLLSFSFLLSPSTYSQDLHFSQFFAAPLSTSPSNTGFFNGDWRIGGNFKSQWPWAIDNTTFNYRTFAVYADFAFLKGRSKKAWMGAGLIFLNDKTGDGRLTTNKVFGSVAYHQAFGIMKKYFLSIGVGAGVVQKSIDYTKLYFNDQWDPDNLFFDSGIVTTEPTGDNSLLYFDMSVGAHFTYVHNDGNNFSVGASMFHLVKPKETFPGTNNSLGIRPVINAIAFTRINKMVHLEPSFLFMYQKKAQEYIINLLAGFTLLSESRVKNSIVFLGAAYRPRDALIPMIGYQYKTVRAIINYDINLSTLTEASAADGGLEISLVYTGSIKSKKTRIVPCPRL